MRDNDGRKLDHATLETLRLRAVNQVAAGAHPEDVAAALGLHRKRVSAYHAKYDRYGPGPVGHVTGPAAKTVTIRLVRSER